MFNNPNGWRRPDLVSLNGRYTPKLSVEVKSGRKFKGVMVDYQLHYAVTTDQDYIELFGEEPPEKQGLLPGFDADPLKEGDAAYYYNVINRTDKIKAQDLNKPFSAIKLKWGSQFIVPHDLAFYNFAINRARRAGESIDYSIEYLREIIQKDVLNGSSHYEDRKSDPNSWQDLHGRDILGIFLQGRKSGIKDLGSDVLAAFPNPRKILTSEGRERVAMIAESYPEFQHLRRVLIPAPNGTNIHALVKPEDYHLINTQLRSIVRERTPVLEKLIKERTKALPLLDRIKMKSYGLYESGNIPEEQITALNLSREEILKLRRLCLWLTEKESLESEEMPLPEKPKDEIPF